MYIKKDQLLNKIIRYRKKDIVKVITGIRRCGNSTQDMKFQKMVKIPVFRMDQLKQVKLPLAAAEV